MKNPKNLYYYSISLITLLIVSWAVADLLRILLDHLLIPGPILEKFCFDCLPYPGSNFYPIPFNYEELALRFAMIIITLPIFFFHWLKTSGEILKNRLDEFTAGELTVRKIYCQIALILNSLTVLVCVTWIATKILTNMLISIDFAIRGVSMPLAYVFVAFLSFVYHWFVLRDAETRLEKIPSTQQELGIGEVRFCGYCGERNKKEFLYCANCGKKLH